MHWRPQLITARQSHWMANEPALPPVNTTRDGVAPANAFAIPSKRIDTTHAR